MGRIETTTRERYDESAKLTLLNVVHNCAGVITEVAKVPMNSMHFDVIFETDNIFRHSVAVETLETDGWSGMLQQMNIEGENVSAALITIGKTASIQILSLQPGPFD